MEEFEKIVKAAIKTCGLEKHIILNDNRLGPTTMRGCIAYIVNEYYPHCIYPMCLNTHLTREEIRQIADETKEQAKTNARIQRDLRRMMRCLKLIPPKSRNERKRVISCTMQLFGFDYTEEENFKRHLAMKRTVGWFEKEYGAIGAKPLKEGYVFTRE